MGRLAFSSLLTSSPPGCHDLPGNDKKNSGLVLEHRHCSFCQRDPAIDRLARVLDGHTTYIFYILYIMLYTEGQRPREAVSGRRGRGDAV